MTVATTNQHELRRRETRDALRRTALTKFAERGFDAVTIAEIAESVGVTERTFYRHFLTKEAVLFQDYETRLEWLSAALALRPTEESVFDSVRVAIRSFPHDLEIVRQAALLRSSLIGAERAAAHLRVVQSSFADVLRRFIAQRHADHPQIETLAPIAGYVLAAALVAAVEVWGEQGLVGDLDAVVDGAIILVRSGFADLH
jgi:AcrR family transcriptional regulator